MRTHPLLRALLVLASSTALASARSQVVAQPVTLRLRPDTVTVGVGQRVPFTAFLTDAAGGERAVDSVTLATGCGRITGHLVFVATRPGRCTVTARHRAAGGAVVRATAVITVREPQHAGRPTPPPAPKPAVGGEASQPDALPQFPWPVPHATTQTPIPRGLITVPHPGTDDRLGDVADSIEKALDRAQLEYAVYAIGDSGFAYVTRVEQIRPTGEPLPVPNRFPSGMRGTGGTNGFLDFLASRFRARPGLFRVMAIVVTSRPLERSAHGLSRDSALALVRGGMVTLPAALRARVVTDLACAAFIYEFETARASDSTAVLRDAPRVPARRHLVAAGMWTAAQLGLDR